jgi:hypothetical protein
MEATTVTVIGPFDSRNAKLFMRVCDASIWWVRCSTCNEGIRVACKDTMADRPHGRLRPMDVHCCTCETRRDHTSCHDCGRCLPPWAPVDNRWSGGRRSDTFYCTNACRQRAYRKRKGENRPAQPCPPAGTAIRGDDARDVLVNEPIDQGKCESTSSVGACTGFVSGVRTAGGTR